MPILGNQILTRDQTLIQRLVPKIKIGGIVYNDDGTILADFTGDNSLDLINELMLLPASDLPAELDSLAQYLLRQRAGV